MYLYTSKLFDKDNNSNDFSFDTDLSISNSKLVDGTADIWKNILNSSVGKIIACRANLPRPHIVKDYDQWEKRKKLDEQLVAEGSFMELW